MIEYQPADDGVERLDLRPLAREGVDLLAHAARSGDADHYQEVQSLLLRDTVKEGDDDGDTDHPDQTPGSWPDELVDLEDG
jgi:hypothetical protein